MNATLKNVITQSAFDKMLPLAIKFEKDCIDLIKKYKLPWHVTRLGVRVEYHFTPNAPRNGGEYEATRDNKLGKNLKKMFLGEILM